jgi:hypothetical protein
VRNPEPSRERLVLEVDELKAKLEIALLELDAFKPASVSVGVTKSWVPKHLLVDPSGS